MSIASIRRRVLALALLAAAGGLASCADAGTGTDGQIPTGLVVVDSRGDQVAAYNGAGVTGAVRVAAGAQQTFRVFLTSASGSRISLGSGGYTLRPTVVISAVAGVSAQGSDEVVVTGRAAGTTSLVLQVLEGGRAVFDPALVLVVGP